MRQKYSEIEADSETEKYSEIETASDRENQRISMRTNLEVVIETVSQIEKQKSITIYVQSMALQRVLLLCATNWWQWHREKEREREGKREKERERE